MGCVVCVPQDKIYILQTCGAFAKIAKPGAHFLPVPCVCNVAGQLSTRITPLDVHVETKTKDNVFVMLIISVQYRVCADRVYEAFYTLEDPVVQIRSYVYDVVRASVPKLSLDEVFESKQDIAKAVLEELREEMEKYGFEIVDSLVVDVNPDEHVRASMNEINANKRLRQAAIFKSEAKKIHIVKAAEGEAESQYLQGVGIARQRKAIVEGMKQAVGQFNGETGIEGKTATDLILVTQYFDTIKDIVRQPGSQTIFYNEEEGMGGLVAESVRQGVMHADASKRSKRGL